MTDQRPTSPSPRPEPKTCPDCRGKGYVPSFGTGLFRDHCVTCNGEGVVSC